MRKDRIKVIKRLNLGEFQKAKTPINVIKLESDVRTKLDNVIKDWVTERQENSRIEKLLSESNILAWKYNQQN